MQAEIAYAAGLFEGEGCITAWGKNDRLYVKLVIRMTDEEPLRRMEAIFGGNLTGPYDHSNKPIYQWQLCGWEVVEDAIIKMADWLSPRRLEKWDELYAKWQEQ